MTGKPEINSKLNSAGIEVHPDWGNSLAELIEWNYNHCDELVIAVLEQVSVPESWVSELVDTTDLCPDYSPTSTFKSGGVYRNEENNVWFKDLGEEEDGRYLDLLMEGTEYILLDRIMIKLSVTSVEDYPDEPPKLAFDIFYCRQYEEVKKGQGEQANTFSFTMPIQPFEMPRTGHTTNLSKESLVRTINEVMISAGDCKRM